jgi:bifunctional UDP-N-acetylglucosamine pyrophosphorylase / glucosamine-1-phosphate N-acetyltransferase
LIAVVLAAGKGTRMQSDTPKVLHTVLGKSIIQRVLEALPHAVSKTIVITGHQAQAVEAHLQGLQLPFELVCIQQQEQLGTGHALQQILPHLSAEQDVNLLITCGDMPLVKAESYQQLIESHIEGHASMVCVMAQDPTGYGRVVLDDSNAFARIIEHQDASDDERQNRRINTGIYLVPWPPLVRALSQLNTQNSQGEYYLTDALSLLDTTVRVAVWGDETEVMGINDRTQLVTACNALSQRKIDALLRQGVTVLAPQTQSIAPEVTIANDTTIHPGCVLEGPVTIASHCQIGPQSTLRGDITIEKGSTVLHSVLERFVHVGKNSWVGPFAHCRDNAMIGNDCKIGNFVEVKEAQIGNHSNAAHLSYLGDVTLGEHVNMGAGSIIANYDPLREIKTRSMLADGVKIGCNSVIISPVTVGEYASVAAGSVITADVTAGSLAIARSRQVCKENWVAQQQTRQS